MAPLDWTFTAISDFADSNLKAPFQHHFDYLLALRSAWQSRLVVPSVWLSDDVTDCTSTRCYTSMPSREFSRGVIRLHLGLISDELSFLTDDDLIDRSNQDIAPHFTLSAERHVNVRIAHNEWDDTQLYDRARYRTHMSLHQVAQILQYRGSEVLAEHAITTAFDGIPGAYVRRTNVTVTVLHSSHQPSGALPTDIDLEDNLDCALIYYPIGPSTPRSLEYLAYAPIGPASPALLLTTKGPASLWAERGDSGQEDAALSSVIRRLALLAEPSLTSLSDSWLRISTDSGAASPGSATTKLPACAMTIGVIYDANEINLVAHIPYTTHDGKQRFLSLLFDTLPFPSKCVGITRNFVRERYRVALALLSLQQHVLRLVTLTEPPARGPFYRESEQRAIMLSLGPPGWKPETPTPSFCSSESGASHKAGLPNASGSSGESTDEEPDESTLSDTYESGGEGMDQEQDEPELFDASGSGGEGMDEDKDESELSDASGSGGESMHEEQDAYESGGEHMDEEQDKSEPTDAYESESESADSEGAEDQSIRSRPDFPSAPSSRVVRYVNDVAGLPSCAFDPPSTIESPIGDESTAALQGTSEDGVSSESGSTQIQLNRVRDVWSWATPIQGTRPDHWDESLWEFARLGWDPPGSAAHVLSRYYFKAALGYLESTLLIWRTGPIPVSLQYREKKLSPDLDSVPDLTVELVAHALVTLNNACGYENWIGSLDPDAYPEHVPRFFSSREDVTNEQRAAVLILLHSFAQSEQLARELASERLITLTIATMFGPLCPYWTTLVTRNTDVDRNQPVLAVFLAGSPDTAEKDILIARRHMARRLHSALTLLVRRHYLAHGWESDHVFTKADAELPINKKFFVFSVFFTRRVFRVDINFPAIKMSEEKSTYIWTFVNGPVMQTQYSHPLTLAARLTIFQALLFIEQHIHLLLKELGLED